MHTTLLIDLIKVLTLLGLLAACQSDVRLVAFSSDGCANYAATLATSENSAGNWCDCCVEHDIAYWRGGTAEQRDQADARLRDCVSRKTRNSALASDLYRDVRDGGSPYFFDGYRWGYGWRGERHYRALNQKELSIANDLLLDYFKAGNQVCL